MLFKKIRVVFFFWSHIWTWLHVVLNYERLLFDLNICLRELRLPKSLAVIMFRDHNHVLHLVSVGLSLFVSLDMDELEPAQKKRREQLAYLESEEFQKILNAKSKHTDVLKEVWPQSRHDWGLRTGELSGHNDFSKKHAPKHVIGSKSSWWVGSGISERTGHSVCKSALLP